MQDQSQHNQEADDQKPLTLWQVAGSVFAAGFGVQSKENKQRDFSRGKAWQFIVVGLAFTVLFLVTVITIVNIIV